jgi:hypothetical protein
MVTVKKFAHFGQSFVMNRTDSVIFGAGRIQLLILDSGFN